MAMPKPYVQYQQQSVLTAPPGELTLMLYNGALRFIKQGIAAMEQEDIAGTNSALTRAQDIICELMTSLDLQYEVANNLLSLYDFVYRSLVLANLKKDVAVAKQCAALITELRDTWVEAVRMTRAH
ncbi:MAG: flagellar export chaperone FliS [Peptococcaceae bacterium]|nr:flagellar export chaperone FliS [Peptococcaceae bacterium]